MSTKILYIEDDLESRELLSEALTVSGFEVIVAVDGRQGLDFIELHKPDLVICDIMLPELSGLEVIKAVSEGPFAAIPFIFLTALDDRDSIIQGRQLGADDYVTKPVDFAILVEIIKRRLAPADRSLKEAPQALTPRELEVLGWVARGKSSMDIGTILGVSEATVDYHMQKVMRKLAVVTRVQAVITALRLRLIPL